MSASGPSGPLVVKRLNEKYFVRPRGPTAMLLSNGLDCTLPDTTDSD